MKEYEDVAASVTEQPLGATGAKGDYLSHLIIFPATESPGAVTLIDGDTPKVVFPGGADSVSSLHPFTVAFAHDSKEGGFKITTGADVSVRAVGDFT
jgi:hypothetical protein